MFMSSSGLIPTLLYIGENMIEEIKQKIRDLITDPLQKEGIAIADLVISRYRNNNALRLFIYSDNGTTLDECARVSNIIGEIIEGTDLFEKGYTLEVSSPGLDRPLTTFNDFKYRAGEKVKISFTDKNKKKISAEIVGAENNNILLKDDNGEFQLELAEIEQAKIIF